MAEQAPNDRNFWIEFSSILARDYHSLSSAPKREGSRGFWLDFLDALSRERVPHFGPEGEARSQEISGHAEVELAKGSIAAGVWACVLFIGLLWVIVHIPNSTQFALVALGPLLAMVLATSLLKMTIYSRFHIIALSFFLAVAAQALVIVSYDDVLRVEESPIAAPPAYAPDPGFHYDPAPAPIEPGPTGGSGNGWQLSLVEVVPKSQSHHFNFGPAYLAGETRPDSIQVSSCLSCYLEFNVYREWVGLRTEMGLLEDPGSDTESSVTVYIFADYEIVYAQDIGSGDIVEVDLNIDNPASLAISVEFRPGSTGKLVLADPVLYG